MRKSIVTATAATIFSLATAMVGTYAWFASSTSVTTTGMQVTVVASGSCDQNLIIWDADTGKNLLQTEENNGDVMIIEFSPSGEYIAAGDSNGHIMVSRVIDASYVCSFAGTSAVFDLKWDKSGLNLAACFDDSTVAIIHLGMFL